MSISDPATCRHREFQGEPDSSTPLEMQLPGFFTARFAILSAVRMRVLFIISIVALAALLWASISILQHIRKAHQKNRESKQEPQAKDLTKS